jgi:peroxiredoxin
MSVKKPHRSFRPGVLSTAACLALIVIALYTACQRWRGDALAAPPPAQNLTNQVGDFALLDQDGRYHQLYRYGTSARVVVLIAHGVGYHAMEPSMPALKALRNRYAQHQVSFLLINADSQDNHGVLQQEAARLGIDVPILKDENQLVVESLGICRTGEALAIDTRTWQIVYRGPVDDRMYADMPRTEARQPDLQDAIEAVLAGRSVTTNTPPPPGAGCRITLNKEDNVSYAKDVAPILTEKCVPCHQAGGVAPLAMDRYETVTGRSTMMREAVMTRHMPPWDADPAYGSFSTDPSLSNTQIRALVHWIDAGSPRGDGPDPLAQAKSAILPEWPLGKPDLIIEVPTQSIPADGVIEYHYINIPVPVDRDVWVRAVDMRPSNRAAMHHGLVFVVYPPQLRARQPDWRSGANAYFAAYVPGYHVEPFPRDTGQLLPKGSALRFQLHYNTVGHVTTDSPRLALYFHKRPPAREMVVESANTADFRIPAHAPDYPVEARYVFKKGALLHAMFPHLHMRGSRVSYEARYPNGRRETLLSVPRYRFDHQTLYLLRRPKPLPAGTEIVVRGAFDNSSLNPANPDPSKEVIWGRQSWDEMFIGYLLYSVPRAAAR